MHYMIQLYYAHDYMIASGGRWGIGFCYKINRWMAGDSLIVGGALPCLVTFEDGEESFGGENGGH